MGSATTEISLLPNSYLSREQPWGTDAHLMGKLMPATSGVHHQLFVP